MKYQVAIILSLSVFTLFSVDAQTLCSQKLRTAQRNYEQGQTDQLEALLKGCLSSGFNDLEKVQARRLLLLANLFDDDKAGAESELIELLKIDPNYRVNEIIDPSELINLYRTYRAYPVFSIGIRGGFNRPTINEINRYGVNNVNEDVPNYQPLLSIGGGLTFTFDLYRDIFINFGALYNTRNYQQESSMLGFTKLTFEERLSFFEFPLYLSYVFKNKNVNAPYVLGGISYSLIQSSSVTATRENFRGTNEAQGPDFDIKDLRMGGFYSAVFGAGIKRRLAKGQVFLEFRYNLGLTEVNDPTKRYTRNDLVTNYWYISPDFTINNFMLSAGYVYSFYRIKKLKKYHAK